MIIPGNYIQMLGCNNDSWNIIKNIKSCVSNSEIMRILGKNLIALILVHLTGKNWSN